MNTLFQAFNKTATTDNGCVAHHSSLSANLDFFYLAGASRGKDIKNEFKRALIEDQNLALRNLQWLRDIRGGAGERQLFRELLKEATENTGADISLRENLCKIIDKTPEIGRFDDLLYFAENLKTGFEEIALCAHAEALRENNGLAFKWTPIKGDTAKKLRKLMGYKTEKDWRKFVVAGRKTVEQQMCAKEWKEINFSHVPSVASARYQKAFGRNASEQYGAYLASLQKGDKDVKINASAVYPYDIYKSCYKGNAEVANEQWKALPNYLEGSTERLLPLIDVSGSMECPAGGNSSLSCMDVAISLGWYLAERNEGAFQNVFMSFHEQPQMFQIDGKDKGLKTVFDRIKLAPWGGNTNIQLVFETLLRAAVQGKVTEDQMPTMIVILSDMQFDRCSRPETRNITAFEMVKKQYADHGYEAPKLVFWNLNADNKSKPVVKDETGTMLVSGFSPSIMKGILGGGMTPEQIMLDTIMIDRYKI